ncbi:MAG: hypothetical protein KDK37_00325, partial [Leptospiraceae bacterium]|nr:hypothetical protein [Leptospiraceae bacterium]
MIRERNQTMKLGLILLDFCLSALSFSLATFAHFFWLFPEKRALVSPDTAGMFAPGGLFPAEYSVLGAYFFPGLIFAISQILVFVVIDIYQPSRSRHPARETVQIGQGVFLNLVIILAFLFFYRGASLSRLVIAYTAVLSLLLHSLGHAVFRMYLIRLRQRGVSVRTILIVGSGHLAHLFYEKVRRNEIYGYRVLGCVGSKRDAYGSMKDLVVAS